MQSAGVHLMGLDLAPVHRSSSWKSNAPAQYKHAVPGNKNTRMTSLPGQRKCAKENCNYACFHNYSAGIYSNIKQITTEKETTLPKSFNHVLFLPPGSGTTGLFGTTQPGGFSLTNPLSAPSVPTFGPTPGMLGAGFGAASTPFGVAAQPGGNFALQKPPAGFKRGKKA